MPKEKEVVSTSISGGAGSASAGSRDASLSSASGPDRAIQERLLALATNQSTLEINMRKFTVIRFEPMEIMSMGKAFGQYKQGGGLSTYKVFIAEPLYADMAYSLKCRDMDDVLTKFNCEQFVLQIVSVLIPPGDTSQELRLRMKAFMAKHFKAKKDQTKLDAPELMLIACIASNRLYPAERGRYYEDGPYGS